MTKQEIKQKEENLIEMIKAFCAQKLNNEYSQLCEKLVKKLGRKRDVPFQRGKPEIWAAAVVNAIGSINFLFDKSFEPYITTDQINEYFGTKIRQYPAKHVKLRICLICGIITRSFQLKKWRNQIRSIKWLWLMVLS